MMHKPDYLEEADEEEFNRLLRQANKKATAGKQDDPACAASNDRATVELQSAASIDPQAIEWVWPDGSPGGEWPFSPASPAPERRRSRSNWPQLPPVPDFGRTAFARNGEALSSGPERTTRRHARSSPDGCGCRSYANSLCAGCPRGWATASVRSARDMNALEKEVQRVGDLALVIIDPVALIATKDSHKNAETRRDLQPLADLCQATGAAALVDRI